MTYTYDAWELRYLLEQLSGFTVAASAKGAWELCCLSEESGTLRQPVRKKELGSYVIFAD